MTASVYYDQALGALRTERVYARGFLHWLYNTRGGGLMAWLLVGTAWPSRLWAALHRTRWSARRIPAFVEKMDIDMAEADQGLGDFRSFHDFFVRRWHPRARPVCAEPGVLVAPVDGKVLAYPRVNAGKTFRIKRALFDLEGLLQDPFLAATFSGGSMLVCRLGLADFHHVRFPDSGTPGHPCPIQGRYHAGGPYAERGLVPFFAENRRTVTRFESDHFGPMAIVEVGALTVGSIRQAFQPGVHVQKGAPKGWFELGGSTVVLLFRPRAIVLDAEVCALTAREIECFVRMGRPLGRGLEPAPTTRAEAS
jgi:phosphatidylserine decarboxylase